jgi:uncharacterized phage-associated protein
MSSVHDVAAYIIENQGSMSAMKLQKLVYYSQAWHLVWEDELLFDEPIEAWANGPVVRALFEAHQGKFQIEYWSTGNSSNLSDSQKDSINVVLDHYGNKDAYWLSELTHAEDPWKEARAGLSPTERGDRKIDPLAMTEYYASLAMNGLEV